MADEVERELKFHVAESFAVPYLGGGGLRHVPGDRQTLDAHYWDTPDLRLTRRGHSLRHRRSGDGSEDTWTLKLAGPAADGALNRREVNRGGSDSAPPDVIVGALRGLLGGRVLEQVCHLRSDRERSYLVDDDGARRVIVEDDRVGIVHDDQVAAKFREVEAELPAGGNVEDLRWVRELFECAGAVRPDPVPKIARALGELARRPVTEPIAPDSSVEDLVRHALRDGLERLLTNDPGVRLQLGPDAVHQARVGTRRLRADLRTLRPLVNEDVVEPLRAELAWIGGRLGAVRDLDVLTEEIRAASAEVEEELDVAPLVMLVDRNRAEALRALETAMNEPRYFALLARIEQLAAVPPLRDDVDPTLPADSVARRLLSRSWRRLERLASDLDDDSPAEQWHETRKKAKGVRYAGELVEPLLGADAGRLARAAKGIQDELGRANDAVNARAWLRRQAATPAAAFSAGRLDVVFAEHAADAHRRWKKRWSGAEAAARFL